MTEQPEAVATEPTEPRKPRTYDDLRRLLFDNVDDKMSLNEAMMLLMMKIDDIEKMVKA